MSTPSTLTQAAVDAAATVTAPARTALMGYLLAGLAALLGLSLMANKLLWDSREGLVKASGALEEQAGQSQFAAGQCNAGVERLNAEAFERGRRAGAAMAAARARSAGERQAALQELATPAAVPGDDYASALARVTRWEQGRARP